MADALRDEIACSWRRCRLFGVAPSGEDVPYRPVPARPVRLLRAAEPVLGRLADRLADRPVSVLLADARARIVDRRGGGRALVRALDRAMIAPGFEYAEEFAGTNGIGTALEERRPFEVSGPEHFRDNLRCFSGVGAPLRHPITGVVEGVLDLTCRLEDAREPMTPLVLAAAREIESRMYADASRREHLLLEHFLRAARRSGTAVVTLNEDVVMANTAASGLLGPSDRALLWEWARQALTGRDECAGEVRLAPDVVVRARATRVGERAAPAGVVVELRPAGRPGTRARAGRTVADGPLTGRSAAAARLRDDVDTAAAVPAGGPLLVLGEAGTGKLFVATRVHRGRHGDEPPAVLDARLSHDDPAAWAGRAVRVLSGGAAVVLRHLDQLAPAVAARVEAAVEGADPARLLATARTRGGPGPAGRVLDHFPVSVTVPPLRYRAEDVADLAPLLLARARPARPAPRLSPAALRVLVTLDWPGNVRELEVALTTAAVRSLGSDIAPEHLAPEYRASGDRSRGASLRRAERDAVLDALAEARGNKRAAAARLGVARSTLYRKMRLLGIDANHLPAGR